MNKTNFEGKKERVLKNNKINGPIMVHHNYYICGENNWTEDKQK